MFIRLVPLAVAALALAGEGVHSRPGPLICVHRRPSAVTSSVPLPPDRPGPHAVERRQVAVPLSGGLRRSLLYQPLELGGSGPGVVLGHGFLAPIARYDSISRRLASHGFRVLVVGYPDPGLFYSRDRIPGDLLAAADWLCDTGRVALVGHSMGGGGAFTAAGLARPGRVVAVAAMSPYPVASVPESLGVPVLIFAAGRDRVAPADRVRRDFFAGHRAPARLITIPSADHSSYLDDAPGLPGAWGRGDRETTLRAVRAYLTAFLRLHLLADSAGLAWLDDARAADTTVTAEIGPPVKPGD